MRSLLAKQTFVDQPRRPRRRLVAIVGLSALLLSSCSAVTSTTSARPGVITAVGAESQYANVIEQLGGKYVQVSSILNNPNTDPHTFEASTQVAEELSAATLVVQNGVGYDSFMNRIESASPSSSRHVLVAQTILGLPASTPNPHLWYSPEYMTKVASAITAALVVIQPAHRTYFEAQRQRFDRSVSTLEAVIAAFKAAHAGTPVAVTEPVADYLLEALGMKIVTPFTFQADIMNGVDPSPQAISQELGFFTSHQAKVFCYNQQVVDALTTSIRHTASSSGVPIVGVYETMPTPGYDYQSWITAEVKAIESAVDHGTSTEKL